MGPKRFFRYVGAKKTHMMRLMITNYLSLKSHVLAKKDLPKPEALLTVRFNLMCRLTGVTAVCTKCNKRVFQYVPVYR